MLMPAHPAKILIKTMTVFFEVEICLSAIRISSIIPAETDRRMKIRGDDDGRERMM